MNSSQLKPSTEFTVVDFDPFAEGEVSLTAPATASQQEIWVSVRMGDDANCAYNESQTLQLRGNLDVESLQTALQMLRDRHESLRMTMNPDGTTLCISEDLVLDTPLIDLAHLDEAARQSQLNALIHQQVDRPFDLEHGPLFRVQIVRLNATEHRVLMTAHHIICDGWSWGILVPELAKIYAALAQGNLPDLEPADLFSDYALTLDDATSAEIVAAESFWLNQFSQSIPVLDLPTDRPRPALRTFESDRHDYRIAPELVQQLKQLGTQMGCSFNTMMVAAFEVLLYRLTGKTEIVVGIPAAGQADSGNYNLVGHCVNLLPLRTTIDPIEPFSSYLRRRQPEMLDAYEHQQLSFGRLIQKLSIPRDPSRIPLVSVVFNIDKGLAANQMPFGLEASFYANPRAFENFELFINAVDNPDGLVVECQYNTNLFDRQTIATRLAEFEILLAGIVSNANCAVATLPLLTAEEREWLERQNQTAAEFPALCLHQLVEAQAARTPDRPAVTCGTRQLTYQELDTQANRLADYLHTLGVKPEVTVGICMDRSVEMLVGVLGILKAGGAYVPIDPAYPKERLSFLLQDANVGVLLTQTAARATLPPTTAQIVTLDADWLTQIPSSNGTRTPSDVTPDNLAYIIYTSGSTGKPKGVQIPHRNAINLLTAVRQQPGLADRDTLVSVTTLSFDIAVAELFLPLSVGAHLVLAEREVTSDGDKLMRLMGTVGATYLQATPATWRLLLAAGWQGKPDLKIISTGEALPRDLASQLLDKGASLWNLYGPTETTIWSAGYQIESIDAPITIGYPLANTQMYILDAQMQPVPAGIAGELHIGGAGIARGYLNRPELTAEKFIPHPFDSTPTARLYKTGDLARFLPNGQIECLGRIDFQVKVRGFRIELGEVEATLSEHPAVKECAIAAWKNADSDERLVAYIVGVRGDEGTTVGELRTFMKQKVPEFMVPTNFVLMDALPLTANGKVDRQALPQPDPAKSQAENYVAPRTEIERDMADIWAKILKLDRVGIHDNFFELGGHSILAAQLISRIRQQFVVEVQLRLLFEASTVAELADRIVTIQWAARGQTANDNNDNLDGFEEGEL